MKKIVGAFLMVVLAVSCTGHSGHEKAGSKSPTPSSALNNSGGTDVGSGGEGAAAAWKEMAFKLAEEIRKIQRSSIQSSDFQKIKSEFGDLIYTTRIDFKSYPLILGSETAEGDNPLKLKLQSLDCFDKNTTSNNERDAINFRSVLKIKVNRARLSCISKNSSDFRRLVLHEYLGLMGFSESDQNGNVHYQYTNAILADISATPKFDFSGLEIKPIKTCEELQSASSIYRGRENDHQDWLNTIQPRKIWQLQNDIDCENESRNGFQPILLVDHLDGNGYSIGNLKIEGKSAALFSFICSRCLVGNLNVVGARVKGVAIFAKWNMGKIDNVRIQGTLIPDFDPTLAFPFLDFGGLVSINRSGLIQNTLVDVMISENTMKYRPGENYFINTGGIAGWNESGILLNVEVKGSMNVNWIAGGIVGRNLGIVRSAKTDLDIDSQHPTRLGGLVGDNSGTVIDSEASGHIRLINADIWASRKNAIGVGGLVGLSFKPFKEPRILNSTSRVKICGSVAFGLLNEIDPSIQPKATQLIQPKSILGIEISHEIDPIIGDTYKILPERDSGVINVEDLATIEPTC